METDLSSPNGGEQFLSQFLDLAANEAVTGNLYDTVVNKWIDPEFVKPSFTSLCRYCKPLIQKLIEDPSYHPRAFFYRKDNLEHVIKYKVVEGGNIFRDPILQESHDQEFVLKAKDEWNNIKTVWSNMLLQLYLNQLISKQLVELQSVDEILKPYIIELYNQRQPELEDVSEFLDNTYYKQMNEIISVATRIIGTNPGYKLYVRDILKSKGTEENLLAFEQSLDPHMLPYVLLFEDTFKYMYPTCKSVLAEKFSLLWPNMFEQQSVCRVFTNESKVLLNTSIPELESRFKKMRTQFDAFSPFFEAAVDDYDLLSDYLSQIVCLYKVTSNIVEDTTIVSVSFQTFRGTTTLYEKQKKAPIFLISNMNTLLHLVPKLKVNKSFIGLWKDVPQFELGGFPVVKLRQKVKEILKTQIVYFFGHHELIEDENNLLLNMVFNLIDIRSLDQPTDFKSIPMNYTCFLKCSLLVPFVTICEQNAPTVSDQLSSLKFYLYHYFTPRSVRYPALSSLVRDLEQNKISSDSWRTVLQRLSISTIRYVCVFYGDFGNNQFDFIVFDPLSEVEKVVNASLYVLVLQLKGVVQYHFLFPMFQKLDNRIIKDWKKGLELLNDTSSLAYKLYNLVLKSNDQVSSTTFTKSSEVEDVVEGVVNLFDEEHKLSDDEEVLYVLNPVVTEVEAVQPGRKPRKVAIEKLVELQEEKKVFNKPYSKQVNLVTSDNLLKQKELITNWYNWQFNSDIPLSLYNEMEDYFLIFKCNLSPLSNTEKDSFRWFFNLLSELTTFEDNGEFGAYLITLLFRRFCQIPPLNVNIDLFLKFISGLFNQSIYLFVQERFETFKAIYVLNYVQSYKLSTATGVLYFSLVVSKQTVNEEIYLENIRNLDTTHFMFLFPKVPQVPLSVFTNFLS